MIIVKGGSFLNNQNITNENDKELLQYEMKNLLQRAKTASLSSIVCGLILGSLASYAVLFYYVGFKGFLMNIAFLLYMSYYALFYRNATNPLKACFCLATASLYLIYIFSLSGILIVNMALYGNEIEKMKILPASMLFGVTILISLFFGPLYTRNIIKRKLYKKNTKTNYTLITVASVMGMLIGKFFVTNILLLVLILFICLLIGFLAMALYYHFYLFKIIKRNINDASIFLLEEK